MGTRKWRRRARSPPFRLISSHGVSVCSVLRPDTVAHSMYKADLSLNRDCRGREGQQGEARRGTRKRKSAGWLSERASWQKFPSGCSPSQKLISQPRSLARQTLAFENFKRRASPISKIPTGWPACQNLISQLRSPASQFSKFQLAGRPEINTIQPRSPARL